MRFNFKKLNFKLWGYFALFTAIILTALWLFQIVFLRSFYEDMKKNEIIKVANSMITEYGKADFKDTIDRLSYNNALRVMVIDQEGKLLESSVEQGMERLPNGAFPPQVMFVRGYELLLQKLNENPSNSVTFSVTDPRFASQTLIFGAKLADEAGNPVILYVSSPLQPIDSTTEVLRTQLVYVTVAALLLGLILSYFIARRLSKPIVKITDTATQLAKGNYDVIFEKGDYAEIDELATTLNFATRELSKVDGLRRDLIANISHDLRTPLTMVKAYGEMIRDISGENKIKREAHLKVIIDEADRLSVLVNDLLDLSQLQSGNREPQFSQFNLGALVKDILSRFHVLSERDGYVFIVNIEEESMVTADKKQIQQVVYNLIGNAVNYTGEDKHVVVTVKSQMDRVRFEVKDTGKGIPPDMTDAIWDRYYKAVETHKRAVVGTGLGLSIVKGSLIAHRAQFGVQSAVGNGSTFWFELKK